MEPAGVKKAHRTLRPAVVGSLMMGSFMLSLFRVGREGLENPSLGFWTQTVSTAVFGFKGWSLVLPQAFCGAVSVGFLYALVKRAYGHSAGLFSALALAFTPSFITANRTNQPDSVLLAVLLSAAWFLTIAAERSSFRWLAGSLALVGLGFTIELWTAYAVLPAFFLTYLWGAAPKLWIKIGHLAGATAILLVASSWWAAGGLPRSPGGNDRLAPQSRGTHEKQQEEITPPSRASVPRVFSRRMAEENSWFLVLALLGIGVAGSRLKKPFRRDRRSQAVLLWTVWLFMFAAYFSLAGSIFQDCPILLAVPIAALSGIAVTELWSSFQRRDTRAWMLALAIPTTALVQIILLLPYTEWLISLAPPVIVSNLVFLFALASSTIADSPREIIAKGALAIGVAALLLTPLVWAIAPIVSSRSPLNPYARPAATASAFVRTGQSLEDSRAIRIGTKTQLSMF